MQYQCERRDLRAVVSVPAFWYVDGKGQVEEFDMDGDHDHNPYVESYTCFECNQDFVPDNWQDDHSLAQAWQAALDHLNDWKAA